MTNSISAFNPRPEMDPLARRRLHFFNQGQPENKIVRPEADPPAVDVKLRRENPAGAAALTPTNVYTNPNSIRNKPDEGKPGEEDKPVSADFNGDGIIDGADLGLLLSQWGTKGSKFDLNGDGKIDANDLKLIMEQWTK